jgi:hypothetical protein
LEQFSPNSIGGDSLQGFIPEIKPIWEEAGKSFTKSGKEVIIVPLEDKTLHNLNKGNIGSKLLFSKIGKDSIEASLLVYVPDSSYIVSSGGNFNIEDFSGFFVFLDLQQQLKFGFYVEKGKPISMVDTIFSGGSSIKTVKDRACCYISETYVSVRCTYSTLNFDLSTCTQTIQTLVCCNDVSDPSGGGGSGGSSGGGGGGGYGSGSGGGSGGGGSGGNTEPINPLFDAISYYNGSMPLGIFQTLGNYVPEGLTFEAINMFLSIKQELWNMGISGSAMEWILNHADYIPILHQVLTGPQDGEEQETLGAIFSFAHTHNLSASQFAYLVKHPELKDQIQNFLTANNNTQKAEDFAKFAIDLIEQDPETKWERLEELYELVENNPDALVNCTNNTNPLFPISEWNDLSSFIPPASVMTALENVPGNWNIQEISNASGTKVNLDYFSSVVNTLPTIDGHQLSADEFISYIRKNINAFVDNTSFNPYRPSDGVLWQSDNPLSAVITITIMPDNGSVITSSFDNCCWVFTTIHAPFGADGTHPVSGNRQFGYKVNQNGTFEFYTKGADRLTTWFHNLIEPVAFNGADDLWESFQDHIKDFVNSHNGVSNVQIQFNNRPDWDEVKEMLTKDYPITSIPCH